jgi:uncharacterized membrane protein
LHHQTGDTASPAPPITTLVVVKGHVERRPPDHRNRPQLGIRLDQRQRLSIALPLGIALTTLMAFRFSWQLSVLSGWDLLALTIAGSIWSFVPFVDAVETRRLATREDDSRALVDVIMLAASLVSLVGVVAGLAHARNRSGPAASALTAVSVFTVFLSWFTVHTLFALRYARLYYTAPEGGIEFGNSNDAKTDPDPDYLDFAYVAFTIGMTFQVSDTGIGERMIRRAVIRHGLLSYLFGTVIVGVAINVVGSLVR